MSWKPLLSPRKSHGLALAMNKTVGSQNRGRMGINSSETLHLLVSNRTGTEDPGTPDELTNKLLVFKVLSVTAASFTIVLLIVLLTICGISYQKRHRRYRRAREYENTVKCNDNRKPISITGVRRVLSVHKSLLLIRKRDSSRLHSQVYFIYNNPAIAAEETEEEAGDRQPSINQKVTDNIKSTGIILNPCVFYV